MSGVVLLDALGTLVGFPPPWPALRAGLAAEGVAVSDEQARRAIGAEIAHYRANLHRAHDAASLAVLRGECAGVVRAALGGAVDGVPEARLVEIVLGSFDFRAFPDVAPALRALRARGTALVVCSNWDVSLHEVLAVTGLAPLLDAVVTSAEVGASKPDPRPFAVALERAGGVDPAQSVHVGDSVEEDVAGAMAAGVRPVLIDRDGTLTAPVGVPVLPSLDGLPALLAN